jgi:hypothetical protein
MKTGKLILGLLSLIVIFASSAFIEKASASAEITNNLATHSENLQTTNTFIPFESANIQIRRTRDGVRVAPASSGQNNDRVKRGEFYSVEVFHYTDFFCIPVGGIVCSQQIREIKVLTVVNGSIKATRKFTLYGFSSFFSWKDIVTNDPAFSNVYFEVYGEYGDLLKSIRLPIGSY